MKNLAFIISISVVLVTCFCTFIQGEATDTKDKEMWQGTLKVPGGELRVVFKISKDQDGKFTATLDSPDQGVKGIVVDTVSFDNGNAHFEVKSVNGSFDGKLKDSNTIEGEWKQSGASLPLVLNRVEKEPEIQRPQEPAKPYPYLEEEVVYENKSAGIKLAGTLTMPNSGGPFPAVLLISGSGLEDRNETVFGHRPFLVLADYLTRQGIAVLRADDRGVGGSTGDFLKAITDDFASDAVAGVEYLKSRNEINSKQIGLIGHSEGGLIAPIAATQSSDVAFIVLMAGTGIIGEEIIYQQSELVSKGMGIKDDDIAKSKAIEEQIFTVVKQENDKAILEKKIREIMVNGVAGLSEGERKAAMANFDSQLQSLLSPWFRNFLIYDPKPTLMKVKCPVLAINGDKDLQVPSKENLSAIEEALKAGGNKDYTVKELPGLNHLFQTAKTGVPSEYAAIEETISPTALKTMGDWILKQVK
ncbi:MAG: uncharacterized protein QG641_727 [Candidatus Poribacteria bacterium]|nr:uncharacterized protein [Candidatus Poribacteria bacterium]